MTLRQCGDRVEKQAVVLARLELAYGEQIHRTGHEPSFRVWRHLSWNNERHIANRVIDARMRTGERDGREPLRIRYVTQ